MNSFLAKGFAMKARHKKLESGKPGVAFAIRLVAGRDGERIEQYTIEVIPWPWYTDKGLPWWTVRVIGPRGRFMLGWSSRESRWAGGGEYPRLRRIGGGVVYAVEQHVRSVFAGASAPAS